ncbi:MAG: hypothetical protein IPH04_06425 [Saprospirales bacterium]|jgi:hypothetical protein|nr:hypothetical protein [Saprospirales bacterium]
MDSTPQKKLMNEAQDSYRQFFHFVTVRAGDSLLVATGKITLRILGILMMIILSPFLFIGLFMAFAAAF